MKSRSVASALLALALFSFAALPVAAEEIDLETAVAMALQSNLGIESEMLNVRQKKLIADTWWNRFYPQASANVTLGRTNGESTVSGLAPVSEIAPGTGVYDQVATFSQTQPRWFLAAGVDISLVLTLQMFPGISLSRLDYENGLITLAQARARVERDVSKQFYQLLLLREQIAVTESQIANAERRFEQAQSNFANGLIDEFTLLSTQVQLENLRPALTGLEVAYQQALLGFKNSLGMSLTAEVTPVGSIDPPEVTITAADIDESVLRGRLDIQQLETLNQILIEQQRATDFGAQGGRMPYLRFGFNVDPAFSGDPFADNLFDGDAWNQRSGAFTISLVQPLDSWLPFSQTRNALADTETQRAQNILNLEQALRGAEIGVRGLLLSIRTSEQTISALENNIALARRAFELAEIGYNNGLRDLLEVQTAEVDLRDAEFQLLQEKKNIMDNVLDLQFELNASLSEIMEMNQ